MTTLTYERLTTTEYPTRYAAFANPGKIVVYAGEKDLTRGGELAVYSDLRPNAAYPNIQDGIFVEVLRHGGTGGYAGGTGGIYLHLSVTRPTRGREQYSPVRAIYIPCGQEANQVEIIVQQMEAAIADAEAFIAGKAVPV